MDYHIAYNSSTDTFTVEDVFPQQNCTMERIFLPTNSLARIDTRHLFEPNPGVVEEVLPSFLLLPLEVRITIYLYCLVVPLQHANKNHNLGGQLSLNLLLVNRQVYNEARFIPMQRNFFTFDRWNGTGLFYCQLFLSRLQLWQRVNIRNIKLNVLAVTLTCEIGVQRWHDLCGQLGYLGRKDEGLQNLQLIISGCVIKHKETFDINAPWVARGLLKLHSLQFLEVTVISEDIKLDLLTTFIGNIRSRLHEVKITLKTIAGGKQSTLYFTVSL